MGKDKGERVRSFALWRRVFLLTGLALSIWLLAYASPAPLVRVESVDVAKMQEEELEGTLVTEQQRFRASMDPISYMELIAKHNMITQDPASFRSFLDDMDQASQRNVPESWSDRVHPESLQQGLTPRVYFRAQEEPVRSWLERWPDRSRPFYVVFDEQDAPGLAAIRLTYRDRPLEEVSIGGSSLLQPPDRFVRPSRGWPLAALLGGLMLYLLLPQDRSHAGRLVYPRWKTYLADLAMVILFGMFFAMPLLIAGSSLQAVGSWLPLTLAFWLMAGLSFWLAAVNAWSASFALAITRHGLDMRSYRGRLALPFSEVQTVAPIEKKTPRWMKVMLVLSVLFSSGSMRFIAAGQLMTTYGAIMRGLRFQKKDGSHVDLWVHEKGGLEIARREEELLQAIDQAGLHWQEAVITERTLKHVPGGHRLWPRRPLVMPVMFLVAGITLAIVLSAATGAHQMATVPVAPDVNVARQDGSGANQAPDQAEVLEWGDFSVSVLQPDWTRVYGGDGVDRVDALVWQQDEKQLWAAGHSTTDQGIRSPGYIMQLDARGEAQNELFYPVSGKDVFLWDLTVAEGMLLVSGTASTYLDSHAILAAMNVRGDIQWDVQLGNDSDGGALFHRPDGWVYWSGHANRQAFLHGYDAQGQEVFKVTPWPDAAGSTISDLLPATEGVWGIGSVVEEVGGMTIPFAARFDAQGQIATQAAWSSTDQGQTRWLAGTARDESLYLTGTSQFGSSYFKKLHLAHMDEAAEILWDRTVGLEGHHVTGTGVAAHPDGDLLFVGNVNTDDVTHSWSFLLRTDRDGNPLSFHRLWADSNLRVADIIVDSEGNIVIGGMTGRLPDRGAASIALLGLRLEHLDGDFAP